MAEIPHFVKGSPDFAANLNKLGDALRESNENVAKLVARVEELEKAPKAPAKAPATRKTTAASK